MRHGTGTDFTISERKVLPGDVTVLPTPVRQLIAMASKQRSVLA
jgi:hypothetical protein